MAYLEAKHFERILVTVAIDYRDIQQELSLLVFYSQERRRERELKPEEKYCGSCSSFVGSFMQVGMACSYLQVLFLLY
jgi:hypothetical protein